MQEPVIKEKVKERYGSIAQMWNLEKGILRRGFPLKTAVDVAISNCVINLTTDKVSTFLLSVRVQK